MSGFKWAWSLPFSGISLGCAAAYHFSWQHDPACKYQVYCNEHILCIYSILYNACVCAFVYRVIVYVYLMYNVIVWITIDKVLTVYVCMAHQ